MNAERPANQADEEAPLITQQPNVEGQLPLPPEISFRSSHQHRQSLDDDDDGSLPSELSSLMPLSTLTPNYNPDLQYHCHQSNPSGDSSDHTSIISSKKAFRLAAFLAVLSFVVLAGLDVVYFVGIRPRESDIDGSASPQVQRSIEEEDKAKKTKADKKKKKKKKKRKDPEEEDGGDHDDIETKRLDYEQEGSSRADDVEEAAGSDGANSSQQKTPEVLIPTPEKRCAYVVNTFEEQNEGRNRDFLKEKYKTQSEDPNVFYRATALIFWQDFAAGSWGRDQNKSIVLDDLVMLDDATYDDGTPMSPFSTWTWVTGDQHLSNFGAWRNRGREVVFSVNDFDEGAIYDFHIDVLRIAVSIASHGFTNGLSLDQVKGALEAFTYMYAKTVINYVGNDKALVYELTPQTATGVLRDFLVDVENKRSKDRMIEKFTYDTPEGKRFSRDDKTRLVDVPSEIEDKIRASFTSTKYGSSMMKMGWKVRGWDDDFFTILDVARRVGSGVGSFGVDRFYVLLKGKDVLLEEAAEEDSQVDSNVILDVKYEPMSAVRRTLDDVTLAWYHAMFQSEADRVAQAQVALTSYTDPYVGYIYIDGASSKENSYNVRQRSPYKDSFDIDSIKNHRVFDEYVEQIAIATATAHVRGTVAKSPGQFKHNIKVLLAGDRDRSRWSGLVSQIALSYHDQVKLDFDCFKEYVKEFSKS